MRTSMMDLEHYPDPCTPEFLLPPYLRRGDNAREERCRRAALGCALEFLSVRQRQAVHMRYDLSMSFRKMAAELGISKTAAEKRVKRSLEILKKLIELCILVQKELNRAEDR